MPKSPSKPPIRVAYDIAEMSAGGMNGGIKTHHYEFLRHFTNHHAHQLELIVFCKAEIVEELHFLKANPYNQIHILGTAKDTDFRNSDGNNLPLHFWPTIPENLLVKLNIDVLYCGFGISQLYTPKVPQISLLVDVLHKDLPEALPPAAVAHRDHLFKQAIKQSTLIQTNSKFCIESLKKHYNIPAKKLFHIYLPLHGRFNEVEMGPLPTCLEGKKYFFYPANHWPHKNHKRLLEGYGLYLNQQQELSPWHLALTGHKSEHTAELKSLTATLNIEKHVHFLDHLNMPTLKSVWEHCYALVFPSLYEGFGLPIVEAMYFQKPIACGHVASLSELDSENFLIFNPYSADSISSTISEPMKSMANNEYQQLSEFQLNKQVTRLIEKIAQTTNPRRHSTI